MGFSTIRDRPASGPRLAPTDVPLGATESDTMVIEAKPFREGVIMSTPCAGSFRRSRVVRAALGGAAVAMALPTVASASVVFHRTTGDAYAMYIADNNGANVRTLPVKGASPVISPDGTRVAYEAPSRTGEGSLRILTLATGAVADSKGKCTSPRWSRDSTRLLCKSQTADKRGFVTGEGLTLVDGLTGASTVLVPALGNAVDAYTWSPDSRQIAYAKGRWPTSKFNVMVADPAAMGEARLLVRDATYPVWGPQTVAVARYTHRFVRMSGTRTDVVHSQIWTVPPTGGGAHKLTRMTFPNMLVYGPSPSIWSPDGARLVALVGGTDYGQLIVVNAASGTVRPLDRGDEVITLPVALSPDGASLLVEEALIGGPGTLRVMSLDGIRGRVLAKDVAAVNASADWAP